MRWKSGRRSTNVEDRRRSGGPRMALGGGIGGIVVVAVIALFLGKDPSQLLALLGGQLGGASASAGSGGAVASTPEEDELVEFVSVVLAETEDVWNTLLPRMGRDYEEPRLVVFRDNVQSACGMQSAAVGPFYCPGDNQVYLDLAFFDDLKKRHGAPGDFAQAYVIAHEIGHHVQNLLGISSQVHSRQNAVGKTQANELSVRLELQADFFAGVWAHHARNVLEQGDLEEALNAASRIGDDRLQREARGYVAPDSFTHGTSEQRMRWFARGFESGDPTDGDTFNARDL